MICSCLIASRGRINRLFAAIHTIVESAEGESFEILVRLDDDDKDSLKYRSTLEQFCRVLIGPRYGGWRSLSTVFYPQLAAAARGSWCWFMVDDMILGGKAWDRKLAEVPTSGFIVHPEIWRIGGSTYRQAPGGNFPCVPNGCWNQFKPRLRLFGDKYFEHYLRVKNGWQTHFLSGITSWHLQDDQEKLEAHRQ